MPWVRFDDQFPIHRKVGKLTDAAFRLHVSAIFWCARNLTDGFVSEDDLDDVCARVRTPERFAAECVARGAWHVAREACDSPTCPDPVDADGWVIHDYFDYQPTKEKVQADREQRSARQARWRERKKAAVDASQGRNASTHAQVDASTHARVDASRNAPVDALVTPAPPRTRPGPTPKGVDGAGAARASARPRATPDPKPSANRRADQCPIHIGQPRDNCAPCASERKAAPDVDDPPRLRAVPTPDDPGDDE